MEKSKLFKIDYYQKSTAYLYPLLRLSRKEVYVPINTYLYCNAISESINDYKLLVLYKYHDKELFKSFEDKLLRNPFFETCYLTEDGIVYIFNLSTHRNTIQQFMDGKYGNISMDDKEKILTFHSLYRPSKKRAMIPDDLKSGEVRIEGEAHIFTSLYPLDFKEELAQELVEKFDIYRNKAEADEIVREIEEICPIFNEEQETLNTKLLDASCLQEEPIIEQNEEHDRV